MMRNSLAAVFSLIALVFRGSMGLSVPMLKSAQQQQFMSMSMRTPDIQPSLASNPVSSSRTEDTRRSFLAKGAAAAALASMALTSATTLPAFADGLPSQGAKAPDFELPNSRGTGLTSLQSLTKTGKWTVLYFYPGNAYYNNIQERMLEQNVAVKIPKLSTSLPHHNPRLLYSLQTFP